MTISQAIFLELSYLDATSIDDEALVNYGKEEAFSVLQTPLNKTDTDLENEDFTRLEKSLVVQYTAYLLTEMRINQSSSGSISGTPENINVKKVKADVVEKEFFENKMSASFADILSMRKKRICNLASQLGIYLELCASAERRGDEQASVVMPARYFNLQ